MTLDPSGPGSGFHACRLERGWILRKRLATVMNEMDHWQQAGLGWSSTCTLSPPPAAEATLRGHVLSYCMRCGDAAANWDLGQHTPKLEQHIKWEGGCR